VQILTGLDFRYASEHAPNGLYKYRHFDSEKDRDRVKRTIKHGEIYFPSRMELNDPFELQIAFRLNPDRSKVVAGLVASAQRAGKANRVEARQIMEWQARLRALDPRVLMEHVQSQHNKRMETECFIFCLCAKHDDPILWAHYADSHKGLCLGFDSHAHPFLGACGINYSAEYPTNSFPRIVGEEDELFLKSALSKSIEWKYEDEYRLCSVRMDENPTWHLDLSWPANQTAVVDPRTIKRVYIGARMPEPRRQELLSFCRHERPDIRIFVGSPSATRYNLEFTEQR
jgi:hypothetical protein